MNALASRGKLITEMSPGSPLLYQAVMKPVLERIQESNLILGPRKPGSTIKMERSFIMGGERSWPDCFPTDGNVPEVF